MNVFTSRLGNRPWEWQVAGLCFVLGLLLAASLQTVTYVNRSGAGSPRVGVPPAVSRATADTIRKQQKEIADLRESQTKLEDSLSKGSAQSKTLNEQLQKAKLVAGLTAVHGPGIVLLMQDGRETPSSIRLGDKQSRLIHDVDLRAAVAELVATGAEALSINGQRITGRTSVRCVGPAIQVNGVPVGSPFEIRAIGDPNTMISGLSMPGGLLEGIRAVDPAMAKVEPKTEVELPAFTGSTETRFAKPAKESDETEGGSGR